MLSRTPERSNSTENLHPIKSIIKKASVATIQPYHDADPYSHHFRSPKLNENDDTRAVDPLTGDFVV